MITPDTKDWTWVLREPCPECGLEAGEVDPTAVGDRVRATLPRWEAALGRDDARERPDDDTWSPTEYACHVRDVFRVFAARTELMLEQDDPELENWDQDETAVADHYDQQDPADVAPQLVEAGERVAGVFDDVPDDAWARTARRSDGASFTVATLAQYFLHDVEHHLHDVKA
ncbi:DinB family protein [Aeromicrobium sp.]|uniref:DinB family protein n=1 Tax=Aeromicrobium sp. TaxID=1871063 RepID=UPI003D6BD29C